ncbi:MAG: ABC transporter substrate-binding protein [Thalassobaculum sp.]|uniref:ABC transporter substrate-binding protein n=1 Tax=Thalassobaculum sp. TaxID=2022740 RepID=UPI0032EBE1D6
MTTKTWMGLAGVSVAAAMAVAAPATAKDSVTIAVPAFLSGPAAGPFGVPARNGAEMVIDAINAGKLPAPYDSKGFAGATVTADFIDESGGNTKQVAEYRNLVQKRGVDAVVGYISSGSCAALAPVVEELKTLTVFAVCGTPRVFEDGARQYIFRTMSHATADNVAAAHYIKDMFPDIKTYTGINQNYAWGQDSWRDFELSMKVLMPGSKQSDKIQFPKIFAGQYGSEISALSLDEAELVHSSFWDGDLEGFIFQATPRGLFKQKKVVFTVGGTAAYRLGKKMPDGLILGARGPYGILVRDRKTALNEWFINTYFDRYGTYPSGPAYQYAQAVLATKIAYDKAGAAAGGFPTQDQVIASFKGMEFESFSTTVKLALAGGHQAVTENVYGITKWNAEAAEPGVTDVKFYPAECVMPPDGQTSVEWIEKGMPGAKC